MFVNLDKTTSRLLIEDIAVWFNMSANLSTNYINMGKIYFIFITENDICSRWGTKIATLENGFMSKQDKDSQKCHVRFHLKF